MTEKKYWALEDTEVQKEMESQDNQLKSNQ